MVSDRIQHPVPIINLYLLPLPHEPRSKLCSCLGRGPLEGCGLSKPPVSASQRKQRNLRVRHDTVSA